LESYYGNKKALYFDSKSYLKGGVALNTPVAASTKKRLDFLVPKVI